MQALLLGAQFEGGTTLDDDGAQVAFAVGDEATQPEKAAGELTLMHDAETCPSCIGRPQPASVEHSRVDTQSPVGVPHPQLHCAGGAAG